MINFRQISVIIFNIQDVSEIYYTKNVKIFFYWYSFWL